MAERGVFDEGVDVGIGVFNLFFFDHGMCSLVILYILKRGIYLFGLVIER